MKGAPLYLVMFAKKKAMKNALENAGIHSQGVQIAGQSKASLA